jgi:Stress responsive A/B Barrel Domain
VIRHVLLFSWAEDSKPEDRAAALKALRALEDTVPEIQKITVQEGLKINPGTYDAILEAEFADEHAYRGYVVNDSHQRAWLDYLQPVCAELASIQVDR